LTVIERSKVKIAPTRRVSPLLSSRALGGRPHHRQQQPLGDRHVRGPSCGAPSSYVLGVDLQIMATAKYTVPFEYHQGFSGTAAATWLSFNPVGWFR
jgi:hypothetical protein